jgi:uncharacterized protein (DUF2235 family)
MPKQIIVLMEGSGNAFDTAPSNVTRMLELSALGATSDELYREQVAIWDYGVGTRFRDVKDADAIAARIRAYADTTESELTVLPPPRRPRWLPGPLAKLAGLAFGCGLESNVVEAIEALGSQYKTDDRLYLFGFSRGAFTARVLAALLYRFGLPKGDARTWVRERLQEMESDPVIDDRGVKPVRTHFMGLWDTVKSYGFIVPVRYFHLRHNPGVCHVRHALALDEKRSWFQCTTWGGLDRDRNQCDGKAKHLPRRYKPDPNPRQTVKEVWFRGCHSDVGGGDRERSNAEIALRWMLQEAKAAGLALNDKGANFLAQPDPKSPILPTESWTLLWRLTDYVPRMEINNECSPALLEFTCWHTGARRPADFLRGGDWTLHPSAR